MKKISLVIPSLQPGGMERVMTELATYFCGKAYIEVHLVLYGLDRGIFYSIPDNIHVHQPPFIFDNRQRLWFTLRTLRFLRKKINELQPDAVLSFGELWNNFTLLACMGQPFPIYVSDRCQPDKPLGQLHEMLRKLLYPGAAAIIAQTEKAKEVYSKLFFHHRIKVIGNPIRNIPADPTVKKENIVLSVGRLIKTKHHDELIRLFIKLNKPDWRLVIVGDDALKQQNQARLQNLIDGLGAADRVKLTGKRFDVEALYLKSKIFAFTSSSEGFPNAIGEAMSAGLPVVAFDCVAGPSDMIIDNQNGFLVPLFDYDFFGERLGELMEDGHLQEQLGKEARNSIRRFSPEIVGQQFEDLLLPEQENL